MANIVIDPMIVRTPEDDASRLVVEEWLGNLIIWLQEALTTPFTWLHYRHASELLETHGQFPNFAHLKQLQQKHRLDINISQVARNINEFFRNEALDLESHLQLLDYAIEPKADSITIEPELFTARLPGYLQDSLHLLLANCCACKHLDFPFGRELHIATLALGNGVRNIAVSVFIAYAFSDSDYLVDSMIVQKIPLLITPDDLLPLTDFIDLWADGERGIIYAIKQQYKKNWMGNAINPLPFRLGPRFIESINRRGLHVNRIILGSIIRAASDVIADKAKEIPGYHLHSFRMSETADSPQLIRDNDQARAWRLMIQKHGAGWRLHYWQIPTPAGITIEFANVCKESEREIY